MPIFNDTPTNLTYHKGDRAILQCSVNNLGTKQVRHYYQSEHLLIQVIMKITLCSTFFYNSVTRYKICFPLYEIIILNITSSGDYFDLSNHLHI